MYRIIAYNPDGTEYTIYDPAGTGALPVLAPRSTEELNQPGSLEFTLLDGHEAFEHLEPKKTYISAFVGYTEFFYGRVLNIDPSPLNGQRQCTCAGALSFLQDTEVPPFPKNASGSAGTQTMTAEAFLRYCISAHNADAGNDTRRTFTVGIISHSMKDDSRQYTLSSYQDTKSVLETNLINHYGGFLRIRRSGGINYIDWVETYGDTDEGVLELGTNIISILNRMVGEELFTAIRPVGKDGLVLSANNGLVPLFPSEAMEEYGIIVKNITFGDAATETELLAKAEALVDRIQKTLVVSSEIKLLDMKFADGDEHGVNLGDMYTQIAGLEGITMIVGVRSRDFESPQNDSCTLQNPKAYEGGEFTENGSGSSLSKRSSKNSSGLGMAYKYIKEHDKELQLNTEKISINAQQLSLHAQQLTETAQEFARVAHNEEAMAGRLDYIEGTGVYQNSEQITELAGKFRVNRDPSTGKVNIQLIEGSSLSVERDGVYSDVVNADGMHSSISQMAEEIRSDVASADSQLYSYVRQTASGIVTQLVNAEEGLYSYTNETASGIRRIIANATNRVWIQEDDPTTAAGGSFTPKDGDTWIESTHQGTWEGAEGFDWEHNEQFDWSQVQGAKIWGWSNNRWELVSDQQQVVSYSDVVETADMYVKKYIKGIVNDEGLIEVYLSKLEQTAEEIRSEVAMSDSSIYSYIHITASNTDLAARNRPASVVSNTTPISINGRPLTNGDIWIQSKNSFKSTWDAVMDDDWGNDEDLNWGEIANSTIYVYQDGKWVIAQDGTIVAEDADLQVLSSTIDMNVKRLQTLDGKVEANYAGLKVDAEQIRSYVQKRTADLGTEIKQTATEIRAEAHAANSSVYSFISITASQIRSEVGNAKSDTFSAITQTANQIRSEVNASNSRVYSSITQTASSIRSEVSNQINGVQSTIEQTASHIRSEVYTTDSRLYSQITQTAVGIRAEVSNHVTNLSSSISVQSDRISLVVEGTGANAKIKPASIVTAINNGASNIIISANHINLDGYVKATDLTADFIKGKIGLISEVIMQRATINTLAIKASGNSYRDMNTAVCDLRITQSGNTYTLQRKRVVDSDWVDVGSFSRATSLSGAWSSNTYTVTASPQGATNSVTPFVQPISSQGGVYVDLYVATGKSASPGYDTHGNAKKLYLVKSGLTVSLKDQNSTSSGSSFASITCSDGNLTAGNIKSGVSIFGVTGTYDVTLTNPSWSNGNPYYDGSSNTVSVSTSGRSSAITRSIPVTISEGAWSNGAKNIDITTTNGSVVARTWISAPGIGVSFDCTDLGPDAEGNDNVVYGYGWHGSAYLGGGSQVIHMRTGSWSNGRIGITSRLNDDDGKVIDRVFVSIPKPVSLQINRTNYSTSGKYEVGSFSKSRLTSNTYMTFTVGGKECYIVVNA